jgi:hypothetical protein
MSTPATLPANFFEDKKGQASPPKTLPANFDFKKGAAAPALDAQRGAAQATGIGRAPTGLESMLQSKEVQDIRKGNVEAGKFGAGMLAGTSLTKMIGTALQPTTKMVPVASKLFDAQGNPIVREVEQVGQSAAGRAVGLTKEGIRNILKWINTNPGKSFMLYKAAEELGFGPHKALKMLHVASKE